MKTFLVLLFTLTLCPLMGQAQATTGWHRVNQVLAREPSGGVNAQVVPYATIQVVSTATGGAATIYRDPLLSSQISPPVVTADENGNYSYYLPLNYCVTENVSSPGSGGVTTPNICGNTGEGITGPGTAGYLSVFTGTQTIGNSLVDYGVTTTGHLTFGAESDFPSGLTGALTGNVTGHASLDLGLAGGTLTGALNVGSTQFIDSSFYGTFALGCAAAQAANATLLLTKTFTNVPTGTYNCNIAVPVGVRSTSALLQVAAGATLTFTGQYSGPFTPWIDITTNSGAALLWNSPSNFYPDYLGAIGNGTTDDGPYLQKALNTVLASGPNYGNPTLYGAPGRNYLTKELLNATCVNGVQRLNLQNLEITHEVTTGSPGAALDIGGCNDGVYYGLTVEAYGNNPANSPMVTSAILLSNGHWTSGYNAEAGGGSFFDHIFACGGYNISTGTGADTASFVDIGADLVTIQNSTLGCEGGGHGSGLVWGGGVGHSTEVTSAFYTFNPSPGTLTAVYSYNNIIYGDYEPAIQFTGSAGYTVNGGYVTMNGTGLGGSELDINASGSQGNGLACQLLNTENQSSNGAVNVFNFETNVTGGAFDCSGRFNTGASLIAVNASTALNRVNIRNLSGGEGSLFALNPTGVQIYDSSFIAGYGTTSLGTVSGANFSGVTLTARNIACSTMTANNGNPAGIGGVGNHYYGINGCNSFSDITVGAGGAFTVNGAGAVSAPSGSITALAAGTVTTPSVIVSNKCVSAASPAVCGSSSSGYVAVPAGTNSTLIVDTTAVTATNGITFQYDESLGTPLGVTCAPGIFPSGAIVTARTAVTSFTIEVPGTTTGYTCGFYTIF